MIDYVREFSLTPTHPALPVVRTDPDSLDAEFEILEYGRVEFNDLKRFHKELGDLIRMTENAHDIHKLPGKLS